MFELVDWGGWATWDTRRRWRRSPGTAVVAIVSVTFVIAGLLAVFAGRPVVVVAVLALAAFVDASQIGCAGFTVVDHPRTWRVGTRAVITVISKPDIVAHLLAVLLGQPVRVAV